MSTRACLLRLLSVAFCLGITNLAVGQDPPPFDEILKVWADRQERISSVTYKIRLSNVLYGEVSSPRPEDTKRRALEGYVIKVKDEKIISHHKNQFGNFYDGFDGRESRSLAVPDNRASYGSIGETTYGKTNRYWGTWPILLWARPDFDNMVCFDWAEHEVEDAFVSDVECVTISPKDRSGFVRTIAFDSNDYLPLQITGFDGDRPKIRLKIEYTEHEKIGKYPSRWTMLVLNENGNRDQTVIFEVIEFTVNEDIPDEEFKIEFPEGIKIHRPEPKQQRGHG